MHVAVSFDLFGTLVDADRSEEPWAAVADSLSQRGLRVPDDWEDAYRSAHRSYERGREAPLDEHVRLALASRGIETMPSVVRDVVLDAFDGSVTRRRGAEAALEAAHDTGPVAICSNCSVPGLVEQTLTRVGFEPSSASGPDAVVTSVDCGWRKPHEAIFEATADALDVQLDALIHVGDDARTDGGAGRVGAQSVLLTERPLPTVARRLREGTLC